MKSGIGGSLSEMREDKRRERERSWRVKAWEIAQIRSQQCKMGIFWMKKIMFLWIFS